MEALKEKGAAGLLSEKRGRPSNNQLSISLKNKALTIIKEKYFDYAPTLAKEKLEDKHDLKLAKETLRQLMIRDGIWRAKKTKEKKVHPRRTRRSRYREMEQIDGSYEYWFEGHGDKCCLLVSVDDATSAITCLRFCNTETTEDYLALLKNYMSIHGRPVSFYSDKHSIFRVNNKKKYEGTFPTRFQEVLKALDIKLTCAQPTS